MRSAPSATSRQRVLDLRVERVVCRTASENESGLALTIPMTSGRPGRSSTTRSPSRSVGGAHAAPAVVQEQVVARAEDLLQRQGGAAGRAPAPQRRDLVAGHQQRRDGEQEVVEAAVGHERAQQRRAALAGDGPSRRPRRAGAAAPRGGVGSPSAWT